MHTGLSLGYIHAGVTCTQDYHRGTYTRVSHALRSFLSGAHTQGCHMHIGVSPGNMQRGVIYAHMCHMHTRVSYAHTGVICALVSPGYIHTGAICTQGRHMHKGVLCARVTGLHTRVSQSQGDVLGTPSLTVRSLSYMEAYIPQALPYH